MPTANATGMQEEFVKNIVESSMRSATVWSEAVKCVGAQNVYDNYEKLMLSWINRTAFMRIVDSTSCRYFEISGADQSCLPRSAGNSQARW